MNEPLPALAGLFFSALVSSTLLPGGSEALLAWLVSAGKHPVAWLLFTATAGNVLGSLITWGMGYWVACRYPLNALSNPRHLRARRWIERQGAWVLLFAWLPVIGDPLCFVAGWLRVSLPLSLIAITLGKLLRYALILGVFS